ncbi:hypothetical protein RM780_01690 [Streptomyces sp. DSM 44917]|uniref:Uncharacterized protein n=1 Tax=Streptomyces boetiae TaxID=3075541 RepID=A0ABU2L283_9ACTN|nr:hypothetical protein [Streptomyces sp. DSM 44917]MDT0305676.1 hypothetical protein [Streptomyces sp. DSM 44917]
MSQDGLYYLPDGFRRSARGSTEAADAAESTRHYLSRATPNAAGYAGADAFVHAVVSTRDTQVRGVAGAGEGREAMARADVHVAATGEDLDVAAGTVLGRVTVTEVSRRIADGI